MWVTERNRHLSVVVVGASKSMRAHKDSRLNVVFLGERWLFSALFSLTSRRTGEETNRRRVCGLQPIWLSASEASGGNNRGQTTRTQYGSEDVDQLPHLPRGHHATMQNACNTASESTRPRVRTCTPSHLHDACTVRDSTVSQSVGAASRPRRHTAPRRHLPIGS